MAVTSMYEVFVHELGDVYDSEHRLREDRGQRAGSANDPSLKETLEQDQEAASRRIENIEQAFEKLGEQPERHTCEATQGLISEAQSGIGEAEGGPVRDILINAAIIKEELYKAAAYRNLINSVGSLENGDDSPIEGRDEVSTLLEENLRETEQAARQAEQNVGGLSDEAKKAGAFRRVRDAQQESGEDKGIIDRARDKLQGN